MESRITVLGHPVHPMLIVLPLGLLSIGVLFDALYLLTGTEAFADVAFWNITVGIVGGLLAAVFGLLDWMSIPKDTRARGVGMWHGIGNVVIVGLFAVSWLIRPADHRYAPDPTPFLLGLIGAGLALGTAWLGGELVYRLRVGVDDDAGLDAPSSLSTEPPVAARTPGGNADAAG